MKFVISIFYLFIFGGGICYGLVMFGSSVKVKVNWGYFLKVLCIELSIKIFVECKFYLWEYKWRLKIKLWKYIVDFLSVLSEI